MDPNEQLANSIAKEFTELNQQATNRLKKNMDRQFAGLRGEEVEWADDEDETETDSDPAE